MTTSHAGTFSPFEPMSDGALLSLGSMEGLSDAPVRAKPWRKLAPGYLAAGLIGVVAYLVHYLPVAPFLSAGRRPISASIIAIVIAVLIRNLWGTPAATGQGCKHIVRKMIPLAIVLTGAGLDLTRVAEAGWKAILITAACMAASAGAAMWLGARMRLGKPASLLIGSGTAVCGTSAIVAVAPFSGAEDEDLTVSVGTVSLLGLLLMFALPAVAGLLGMSQREFGVWAGTSIHAVPQVVAAGFTYGPEAGALATLVKLARVAMLAPFLAIALLLLGSQGKKVSYRGLVPGFVAGFFGLALLATVNLVPALRFNLQGAWWGDAGAFTLPISEVANWIMTLAMAAIGLEVNLRLLVRSGGRALAVGFGAMIVLCVLSYSLIRLFL